MVVDPRGLNHPIAAEHMIDGVEIGVYRASAVGMCDNALLAARMGIEGAAPPEQMQKVFSEGHDNEQTVLDLFYAEVDYLESATRGKTVRTILGVGDSSGVDKTVTMPIGSTVLVVGHVDDIAVHGTMVRTVVEAKAVGKDLWKQWESANTAVSLAKGSAEYGRMVFDQLTGLWQKYRDQAEVYMAAAGATECAFVVGRKPERETDSEGVETRGLVEEISYVWIKPDMTRLGRIKAKIAMVEARARGGAALPGECPAEMQQWPCPYYYLLHKAPEKVDAIKIDSERLAAVLKEHYEAAQAEKAGKKAKEVAKGVLDELWRSLATTDRKMAAGEVYECGGFTVKYMERPMPAGQRKAYVQKFYTVDPIK